MDSPTKSSPLAAEPPQHPRWLTAIVLIGFLFYSVFLARHMGAYGGGSDTSGYLNNAHLLAEGTTHMPQRLIPGVDTTKVDSFAFIPLGFRPMPDQRMAPTYPIGLPLSVAALAKLIGWDAAPHVAMGLSAIFGLILTAMLGRCAGLPWIWSWFGALILGASPLYSYESVQLMSDVPATAFAILTVICAWYSRERPIYSLLAGLAMAGGVLLRPSSIVMILPVAFCLGVSGPRWLGFIAGAIPGAILQCIYNWHAYGSALESGYGSSGGLFKWANIPATLHNYGQWLPVLLTPVGLLGLTLPWFGRRHRFAWVLVVWMAALLGFYLSYYHTHETWWYLRFVLPAFPACIVGGLWIVRQLWLRRASTRLRPIVVSGIVATLVAVVLAQSAFWHRHFDAARIGRGEAKYREVLLWANAHLPANATIAAMQCSGALICYTDFTFFRYDIMRGDQASILAHASLDAGRPVYAILWPQEVKEATEVRLPGRWTQEGNVQDVTIWKWSP